MSNPSIIIHKGKSVDSDISVTVRLLIERLIICCQSIKANVLSILMFRICIPSMVSLFIISESENPKNNEMIKNLPLSKR